MTLKMQHCCYLPRSAHQVRVHATSFETREAALERAWRFDRMRIALMFAELVDRVEDLSAYFAWQLRALDARLFTVIVPFVRLQKHLRSEFMIAILA